MFKFCGFCSNEPLPGQYAFQAYNKIQLTNQMDNTIPINNIPSSSVFAKDSQIQDFINENKEMVVKKTFKSNYIQLIKKYQQSKEKFTDSEFPPDRRSIGVVVGLNSQVSWKRIPQIIKNPQFISQHIKPEDMLQNTIGDCDFLGSVAALAQKNYRIKKLFHSLQVNPYGIYMARLLYKGVLTQVVVDDFIPVSPQGTPLFAKSAGNRQIWVMILEKCWAKLHGCYAAIQGVLPKQVLHSISGAPTFSYPIAPSKQVQQQLWINLISGWNNDNIICCKTKEDQYIQKFGLINSHPYTVLGVYQIQYKIIKLRNPWNSRNWNGRASDIDKQFWGRINSIIKQKIGFKQQNQGLFFMVWEDFVNYFDTIDICKIDDNASYFNLQITFDRKNAQIFELQTQGGSTTISITQNNKGNTKNQQQRAYGRTTMIVSRQTDSSKGYEYKYIASSSEVSCNHYLELNNLQPGKYVIYAKCNWIRINPDQANISIYTSSSVNFKKSKQSSHDNLLYKTFLDHSRKNQKKQIINQLPFEWICSDFLNDCGYGYFVVHLDEKSTRKIGIQINQKDYNDKKLVLKKPYKNKGQIKTVVEPGKQLIILFKIKPSVYPPSITLPSPKIYNLI